MTTTTTTPATPVNYAAAAEAIRYIFKCECGAFRAADLIQQGGKLFHWNRAEFGGGTMVETTWKAERACPCGLAAGFEHVQGHFSYEHICDPSCTSARGSMCMCSCGGANHGMAWVTPTWRYVFKADAKRRGPKAPVHEYTPEVVAAARAERDAVKAAKAERARINEQFIRFLNALSSAAYAAEHQTERAAWMEKNQDVVAFLDGKNTDPDDFVNSLARQLMSKGELSDRQVEALRRVIARRAERAAAAAEREALNAEARIASRWQGTVGERRTFTATPVFTREVDSQFGVSLLVRMADAEGNILTSFVSGQAAWDAMEQAKAAKTVVTFVATVKHHDERDGVLETQVTRIKVQ